MYLPILREHLKIKDQRRTYLMILMRCLFSSSDFLYKSICSGYSFELHRQVDAIQMGTHNIHLLKKQTKSNLAVV